jgi:hypothetical protein
MAGNPSAWRLPRNVVGPPSRNAPNGWDVQFVGVLVARGGVVPRDADVRNSGAARPGVRYPSALPRL